MSWALRLGIPPVRSKGERLIRLGAPSLRVSHLSAAEALDLDLTKFTLRKDHRSLAWLQRFKDTEGMMVAGALQQFHFSIIHRPGDYHGNSDGLSLVPGSGGCFRSGERSDAFRSPSCEPKRTSVVMTVTSEVPLSTAVVPPWRPYPPGPRPPPSQTPVPPVDGRLWVDRCWQSPYKLLSRFEVSGLSGSLLRPTGISSVQGRIGPGQIVPGLVPNATPVCFAGIPLCIVR